MYAGLSQLIDEARARGELRREVPSQMLAHNLFAVYFQHVQGWLSSSDPALDFAEPKLRDALELQLADLRKSGARGGGSKPPNSAVAARNRGD